MRKTVLDVGNCSIDHHSIQRMIRENFGAEVLQASGPDDALAMLSAQQVDLILVNRRLHGDFADGIEFIKKLKGDPKHAQTPVMLLSDFPRYQHSAVEAGAELGFGKSELASPETPRKLRRFLG